MMTFEAIVPAYNEGPRITGVITALRSSPLVDRVLVVDDGSSDDTAVQAERAGAQVLRLGKNGGKGPAMLAGVGATRSPYVGFFDADLKTLHPEHLATLTAAAAQGYDMVCGLRDYGMFNGMQLMMPIITGERLCHRSLLQQVPRDCWSGFSIEVALNATAARIGARTACVLLDNLQHTNKTNKRGWLVGAWKNIEMMCQVLRAADCMKANGGQSCQKAS